MIHPQDCKSKGLSKSNPQALCVLNILTTLLPGGGREDNIRPSQHLTPTVEEKGQIPDTLSSSTETRLGKQYLFVIQLHSRIVAFYKVLAFVYMALVSRPPHRHQKTAQIL